MVNYIHESAVFFRVTFHILQQHLNVITLTLKKLVRLLKTMTDARTTFLLYNEFEIQHAIHSTKC
jgi:hypothetical protein